MRTFCVASIVRFGDSSFSLFTTHGLLALLTLAHPNDTLQSLHCGYCRSKRGSCKLEVESVKKLFQLAIRVRTRRDLQTRVKRSAG